MAIRKTLTNLNVLTSTNLIQSKSFALNGGNFDGGGNRATNFVNLVETNTPAYTNTAALAAAALPKAGGTMTGALTNDVAVYLPVGGTCYFGTTNYITDQGSNFGFKIGTNDLITFGI